MKEWMTIPEVARYLAVGVRTVYRMVAEGELQLVKMRRCSRIAGCDVLAYVERAKRCRASS
jgi:excisionase family DNA binding protein